MTVNEFESLPMVSLGVLEDITGIERRRLRRQLLAEKVPVAKHGNKHVVARAALKRIVPDFYEGILERLTIETFRADRAAAGQE